MRLCGISSRFQLLSPCTAGYPRVTHPSATQSPIDHPKNLKRCFVRLACVRHAASVHPEPGSNSQIKCSRCQIKVQNHCSFPVITVYLGFELSFCSMDFPADITLRKTRMKFELTFKVVLLFSYQGFVFSFENA